MLAWFCLFTCHGKSIHQFLQSYFIDKFMEKDSERVFHWFDVADGEWIQGLVASVGSEQRAYVVTVEPPMQDAIHDRWPRTVVSSV